MAKVVTLAVAPPVAVPVPVPVPVKVKVAVAVVGLPMVRILMRVFPSGASAALAAATLAA
jgi:hypothetical protein